MTIELQANAKFALPDFTAKGEARAIVPFTHLETLWFNTGSLCNIACENCYIESSPKNDDLVYLTLADVNFYLEEIRTSKRDTKQIALTGGEPFMNPDILGIIESILDKGFELLVLTNAMRPMQRPKNTAGLLEIKEKFGTEKLTMRVSLDHYGAENHDAERGKNSFDIALVGLDWLSENDFKLNIAGRTLWNEDEKASRAGYEKLISDRGWNINPLSSQELVLFPEMDMKKDVPEISVNCWDILGTRPQDQMCSTSRMIVKRKGADKPTVLPCTLIAYREEFDMGHTLEDAENADSGMFKEGGVKLCHPFCAKFCVLGGGSCTVAD